MYPLEKEAFELIKKSGSIIMRRIGEILDAPMDEVRYVCNSLAKSNDIVIQDGIDNDDKPCQVCSIVKKEPARAMSKAELAIEIIKVKGYATSKDLKDAMGVMSPQPYIKNQLQNGTIVYRDGRYFLGRAIVKDPEIRPSDTPKSENDTEKSEYGTENACSCQEQDPEHPVIFQENAPPLSESGTGTRSGKKPEPLCSRRTGSQGHPESQADTGRIPRLLQGQHHQISYARRTQRQPCPGLRQGKPILAMAGRADWPPSLSPSGCGRCFRFSRLPEENNRVLMIDSFLPVFRFWPKTGITNRRKKMKNMDFGDALRHMKKGGNVARAIWNRKKWIEIKDGKVVMGNCGDTTWSLIAWQPTHEDMLSNDWHTIAIGIAA